MEKLSSIWFVTWRRRATLDSSSSLIPRKALSATVMQISQEIGTGNLHWWIPVLPSHKADGSSSTQDALSHGSQTSFSNCTVHYQGQVHHHVTGTMWHHSRHEPSTTGNEGAKLQGRLYQTLCLLQSIWEQRRCPGTCKASKAMPKDQAHKHLLSSFFVNTYERVLSRSSSSTPNTRLLMHSQKLWQKWLPASSLPYVQCVTSLISKPPKWGSVI